MIFILIHAGPIGTSAFFLKKILGLYDAGVTCNEHGGEWLLALRLKW